MTLSESKGHEDVKPSQSLSEPTSLQCESQYLHQRAGKSVTVNVLWSSLLLPMGYLPMGILYSLNNGRIVTVVATLPAAAAQQARCDREAPA